MHSSPPVFTFKKILIKTVKTSSRNSHSLRPYAIREARYFFNIIFALPSLFFINAYNNAIESTAGQETVTYVDANSRTSSVHAVRANTVVSLRKKRLNAKVTET